MLDVVIRNGRVVDGSGLPWVRADVGITGDRITGQVTGAGGATTPFAARRVGAAPPIGGAQGFSDEEGGRLDAELGG